jgi:hypothetical protein
VTEHVGALGSVDADISTRERLAFWARLPQRLASLGNRVGEDQHRKVYDALHAHVPMVTPDEQWAIQTENVKDDEQFWDAMQEMNASSAEGHKLIAAAAEAKRQEHERQAADAVEKRDVARGRLAKLARGESVAGGLGKKVDMGALAKAAGLTAKDIRRARMYAFLTENEFETASKRAKAGHAAAKAGDRAMDRVLRERSG